MGQKEAGQNQPRRSPHMNTYLHRIVLSRVGADSISKIPASRALGQTSAWLSRVSKPVQRYGMPDIRWGVIPTTA